jgi:transcription antitermination factor NusG
VYSTPWCTVALFGLRKSSRMNDNDSSSGTTSSGTTSIEKGDEIRLVKGKYEGQQAWMNKAKKPTKCYYFVIVVDDDGTERATRVLKGSARIIAQEPTPTSYEEAVIQQHPDIERAIDKLCELLVECGINKHSDKLARILETKIEEAKATQDSLSYRAKWRHVEYETDEID